MIRLAGAALVVASATLLGFRASEALDIAYREAEDLHRILCMLQGEIRYARSFLGEALLQIAGSQKDPYKAWLRALHGKMERRQEGSLPAIWEETTRQYLGGLALGREEKERLGGLGVYLGSADAQMQIRHLELYTRHLEEVMEEMRRRIKMQKKLYRILGMSGGILAAVLLI